MKTIMKAKGLELNHVLSIKIVAEPSLIGTVHDVIKDCLIISIENNCVVEFEANGKSYSVYADEISSKIFDEKNEDNENN